MSSNEMCCSPCVARTISAARYGAHRCETHQARRYDTYLIGGERVGVVAEFALHVSEIDEVLSDVRVRGAELLRDEQQRAPMPLLGDVVVRALLRHQTQPPTQRRTLTINPQHALARCEALTRTRTCAEPDPTSDSRAASDSRYRRSATSIW
jgi:hypothetical protein